MIDSASGVLADAAKTAASPTPGAELERDPQPARQHVAQRRADEEERRHLATEKAGRERDRVKISLSAKA